ncbi:alpha/beta fold hydrolase [Chitinophaga sp.]|uniref:alpha/beta hydrolase family protein n=1 Tax=Chitinophaga sp. TaxID=1869181 RepID=UPI0031D9F8C5
MEKDENNAKISVAESITTGTHWTTTKYSRNILHDALVKHLLSLMTYGMSDLGEVLEVVGQLEPNNEESWVSTWGAMAQRLQNRAAAAEGLNNLVTASTAYLRASTYWRAALMYFSDAGDPRMRNYAYASSKCYERYLALSGYPGQYVEIPYENSFLPGHFYRSPVAKGIAPLLIITPGRDTWAEDTRWVYDGALRRGIHCLIYDGPGQGFALRLNNLAFRPDWEKVVTPVIDFALTLEGIDPSGIALMGLSFGGFLVPRAAAFDKRIKICIADPGNISWGEGIINALKKFSTLPSISLPAEVRNLVKDYAWKHNVPNTIEDVINALQAYNNTSVLDKITCNMLVLDGTEEMLRDGAKKFYDALNCPKHYMIFDEATTAQSHCQIGGYATATEYIFDWLCQRL